MKICILTAGKGTRMGPVDRNINKALLPIRGKAIISHIIEYFDPDDEFVIGLGYMGQQIRDYLKVAYPDRLFHFINIDKFEGAGSGPGYSLLCCKNFLLDPFYFIPCDCLFDSDFRSVPNGNWIGTKSVDSTQSENYCNAKIRDGIVVDLKDKEKCPSDFVAFTGFLYVKDLGLFVGFIGMLSYGLFHETFKLSQGAFIFAFLFAMYDQHRYSFNKPKRSQ